MPETNRYVLDGSHVRVFVTELQAGDVTILGETVAAVERVTDLTTIVAMTNGEFSVYRSPHSTILIQVDPHEDAREAYEQEQFEQRLAQDAHARCLVDGPCGILCPN